MIRTALFAASIAEFEQVDKHRADRVIADLAAIRTLHLLQLFMPAGLDSKTQPQFRLPTGASFKTLHPL